MPIKPVPSVQWHDKVHTLEKGDTLQYLGFIEYFKKLIGTQGAHQYINDRTLWPDLVFLRQQTLILRQSMTVPANTLLAIQALGTRR